MSGGGKVELVAVRVANNEFEAQLIIGVLAESGIQAVAHITNMGFGAGGEMPVAGGGPRNVFVRMSEADRARRTLADYERAREDSNLRPGD